MMKNSYKILFLFTIFSGTMVSICSFSWFSIWMGLEINLLSFIPLSMKNNNLFSSESLLKYFLTQALASSILLFSIIFFSFFEWIFFLQMNYFLNMIFSCSLMMKSGAAPFHFWFPSVMEGLNWMSNMILMTWQKIAPLIIMMFCMNKFSFSISIILSTIIGAMGGLNQTSLRKILAYSSINHLGWMLSSIFMNLTIWKIYFLFYSFLSISIILIFDMFKFFYLNQLFLYKNSKLLTKSIFFIPLLSLGGLPPFMGFFPKWIVIESLINFNFLLMLMIMIISSLITLYFYIRISYSGFLMNYNEMNWFFFSFWKMKKNMILYFFLFLTIFGLFLINLMFLF